MEKTSTKIKSETNNNYNFFFSRIYDAVFFPFLHTIRKAISKKIVQQNGQKVIDICCGTGNQICYLEKHQTLDISGIDLSDNMLAVAKKRVKNSICLKQDATNTEFQNNTFDIALLSFVLHETSTNTASQIMIETNRILKSNGKIIIVDYVFDSETSFLGKVGAICVEALIGGTHYQNFKNYTKNKLLNNYTSSFKLVSETKHLFGSVRVLTFENNLN